MEVSSTGGLVIIVSSLVLKGTGNFDKISNFLILGAVLHLIIIWGPLAVRIKKEKEDYAQAKDKEKITISE